LVKATINFRVESRTPARKFVSAIYKQGRFQGAPVKFLAPLCPLPPQKKKFKIRPPLPKIVYVTLLGRLPKVDLIILEGKKCPSFHFQNLSPPPFTMGAGK